MLKTNSKQARENIFNYILSDSEYINERAAYDGVTLTTPAEYCKYILECFKNEKSNEIKLYGPQVAFERWASGLPLGGLFDYYYNVPAVGLVASILEENETESARFTESQAESFLTALIYNELVRRAA